MFCTNIVWLWFDLVKIYSELLVHSRCNLKRPRSKWLRATAAWLEEGAGLQVWRDRRKGAVLRFVCFGEGLKAPRHKNNCYVRLRGGRQISKQNNEDAGITY